MSRKHEGRKGMPQYGGLSGYSFGSIVIMLGLAVFLVGGYLPGIIIITIGAVIMLDYFLIKVFLKQTSPRNKHRVKHR